MDELSRKFRSIDWKGLQKQARRVQASTASALKDMVMTDLENKTRAATADTSWGASGADLMAIAHGTYRREDYALIMSIVWQRLASSRRRCVYKALELLKFLIMHGAGRCTDEARVALPHLRALTDYMAVDEHGQDVGEGVRKRASLICQMLADEQVLENERAHSRELRTKLQGGIDAPGGGRVGGLSSDDYRYGQQQQRQQQQYNNYGGYPHHGGDGGDGAAGGGGGGNRTGFGGTAMFKGYGDDDDNDAAGHANNNGGDYTSEPYDDVPNGQFAQRAKKAAAVDDLLGDDTETSTSAAKVEVNTNDDNPTITAAASSSSTTTSKAAAPGDDLLSDLNALSSSTPAPTAAQPAHVSSAAPSTASSSTSGMTTSQLVLHLAAQRQAEAAAMSPGGGGGQHQKQLALPSSSTAGIPDVAVKVSSASAELFGVGTNGSSAATGAGAGADGGNLMMPSVTPGSSSHNNNANGNTPTIMSGDGGDEADDNKQQVKVLSRVTDKDKDPFADLLSSGKKSGML